jgi:CheY-like chemotaxis protein
MPEKLPSLQKMGSQKFRILIVDDNRADVEALKECISQSRFDCLVEVAEDSFALSRVIEQTESDKSRVPQLVFMDVHLPRSVNGLDLSRMLRRSGKWKYIPLIALSGSNDPQNIKTAYDCGMSAYVLKCAGLDELKETVHRTLEFWLDTAILPDA